MFSNNYHCGSCHKLRLTPEGKLSVCLNDEFLFDISNLTKEQKLETIKNAINRRETIVSLKERVHYRSHLGALRFGEKENLKIDYSEISKYMTED